MQVFIIGNPLETAQILDSKRFNKQIIETKQILSTLRGNSDAWKNHPCVLQYKNHIDWLEYYERCFLEYKKGNYVLALSASIFSNRTHSAFSYARLFRPNEKKIIY